ncbi:MAG: hypothetical protein V4664_04045 [Patescibacteria group bacterium]
MDRFAFVVIFLLFLVLAGVYVFAPYLYGSVSNGELSVWFYPAFFINGLLVVLSIKYLHKKYGKEYDKAYAMSYTPKNKYGWYALWFFIIFMILFYTYAVLTKR